MRKSSIEKGGLAQAAPPESRARDTSTGRISKTGSDRDCRNARTPTHQALQARYATYSHSYSLKKGGFASAKVLSVALAPTRRWDRGAYALIGEDEPEEYVGPCLDTELAQWFEILFGRGFAQQVTALPKGNHHDDFHASDKYHSIEELVSWDRQTLLELAACRISVSVDTKSGADSNRGPEHYECVVWDGGELQGFANSA